MSAMTATKADSNQLASRIMDLFLTADAPVVAVVHDLLVRATEGDTVRVSYVNEPESIEITLVPTALFRYVCRPVVVSVRVDPPRAGVKLRIICARLANLCRGRDGSKPNVYGGVGVIPYALVESLRTLHDANPAQGLAWAEGDRLLEVEYNNDKRWPLGFVIKPAENSVPHS